MSQQAISQLEQKEMLDASMLKKVLKALGVSEDVITSFNDEAAINIVANTINNHDQASVVSYYPTFIPMDKIIELYERLLAVEKEENELLQNLIEQE